MLRNLIFSLGDMGAAILREGVLTRILREACRRLEIEGVSSHSFRRTALTRMSDAGIPLRHIQAISGHRSLAALECYLGVTERQKAGAIASLDFKSCNTR